MALYLIKGHVAFLFNYGSANADSNWSRRIPAIIPSNP